MAVAVIHHQHSVWVGVILLAVLVFAATVFLVQTYRKSKKNSVNFDVPVGVTERHSVSFLRNAFTGRLRISVDGLPVHSKIEWVVWRLEKRYEIPVGESERHRVTFVRTRKKLAPGFLPQPVTVYIDGAVAANG